MPLSKTTTHANGGLCPLPSYNCHRVTALVVLPQDANVDLLAHLDPTWEGGGANLTWTHLLLPFEREVWRVPWCALCRLNSSKPVVLRSPDMPMQAHPPTTLGTLNPPAPPETGVYFCAPVRAFALTC